MAHINIYLSDDDFFMLRKLKDDLKCKTQEELLHKMIEIVQQQLSSSIIQQHKAHHHKPQQHKH